MRCITFTALCSTLMSARWREIAWKPRSGLDPGPPPLRDARIDEAPGRGPGRDDMTQPDIVIIMANQLAPQFIRAYGYPVAKTPHMDALVAHGMRFDAAYCNSPLCAPSRFAFMSGQLISWIAAYENTSEFRASVPTFAHYLTALGYRTCL